MPLILYLFVLVELLAVTFMDVKYKIISNYWLLLNMIFLFVLSNLFPQSYTLVWNHFLFSAAILCIGFFLFSIDIIGAGDIKYLTTLFLIIPSKDQKEIFLILNFTTIVVGFCLLIYKTATNFSQLQYAYYIKDRRLIQSIFHEKFSYSSVILLTWIIFGIKNWKIIFR